MTTPRRQLLAASAVVPAGAAYGTQGDLLVRMAEILSTAKARQHPDAELLALGADLDRVSERSNSLPRDAEFALVDALTDEGRAIVKRMLVIRPTTLEGHRAKARAFVWCADEMPEDDYFGTTTDARMAVAIIRDLLDGGQHEPA